MKRILIALAVLFSVQFADAQVKSPADAKKAVESAENASQDPKKAAKVATWMKLASAYMDAYNAPAGSAWIGASQTELKLIMGTDKPKGTAKAELGGEACTKEIYADKEFYYNANGQLIMINVTQPVYEDALGSALDAYKKAYEVDLKASKKKDILSGIETVAKKYYDEGMNKYMLDDYAAASVLFARAAEAAATEPLNRVDTTSLYNAGFTAWMVKDYDKAKQCFEKCLAAQYYYEGGEVFAKLADVYAKLGDKDASRNILEQGFVKFPQSQSILIGLINYYLENNENPERLFDLIGMAKQNEPNNASLYYVEGNIYKELGQLDKAVETYYKCGEINPEYEFGYIGAGILYYNLAIELQEKAANEFDDKKYEAIQKEFVTALKNALEPFEKAYAISKDDSIKVNIAEYLKNIYYRFSTEGPQYKEGYDKYNKVVKEGKPL